MLVRKRAFDVMREDFAVVGADEPLSRVVELLTAPGGPGEVVVVDEGGYVGVLTERELLSRLGSAVLGPSLGTSLGSGDMEEVFGRACGAFLSGPAGEAADRGAPVVAPGQALFLVVDDMLRSGSDRVVVRQGEALLGVIGAADIIRAVGRGGGGPGA